MLSGVLRNMPAMNTRVPILSSDGPTLPRAPAMLGIA
jgi:hypothetical protein